MNRSCIQFCSNKKSLWIYSLIFLLHTSSIFSQYYFGRNKIQYEQFNWHVINTDHFEVYYYEQEKEIAQLGAYFAEEAFNELEQKFNHTLDDMVPLVLYSNHIHFQQTNILPYRIPEGVGGFFEFIKGRVVIPFTGSIYDFRHVIRHELVHVFTHSKINQTISDAGKWDSPSVPLWFIEGLAEWWSVGWDTQAEMVIRDALLYDHLYPLDSFDLQMTGFLLYKEGQSFLQYYEDVYGADRLRKLMSKLWQYNSFEEAITDISHKEFKIIQQDWELSLKKKKAETLKNEKIPGSGNEEITQSGANVSPALYTDSSGKDHTVYLSNRDGYTNIYLQGLRDTHGKIILKGGRTSDLESFHFLQSGLSVNRDGILTFVTKSGKQDVLKMINLTTQKQIGEFSHPKIIMIRSPKWSPNGENIIFSGQDYSGQSDLYLWDTMTSELVRLTDDIYSDRDPCFFQGDDIIVFSSDRGSDIKTRSNNLFLLTISTGQIHYLTNNKFNNRKPFWYKENDEKLIFISDRSGTPNVWELMLHSQKKGLNQPVTARQLTFYHTGVLDAVQTAHDSMLVTIYKNYSFQLHHIGIDSTTDSVEYMVYDKTKPMQLPHMAIRDTSVIKGAPYKLKYSLDFAQTAVAYDPIFGFLGGAQLGISDLLGNKYYHFLVANSAGTTSEFLDRMNVAVTYVDLSHKTNRAIGFFHFANDYYRPNEGFFFERSVGLRVGLNYPLDVFKRFEFSSSFWHSTKDFYFYEPYSALLLSNYISFVHDNSLWTFLGPIDGWRFRLTVGPTFDFKRSSIHNYVGLLDFRIYLRPLTTVTFAQRTMILFNAGRDIHRFNIGGSWGLRGYSYNGIYGSKAILLNQEIRIPFAQSLILKIGTTDIGFAPIRGAIFFDVGNAWDDEFPGLIGSFGFGLRGLFAGAFVLRLDIAKRTDFTKISNKWYTQLFFGWNY